MIEKEYKLIYNGKRIPLIIHNENELSIPSLNVSVDNLSDIKFNDVYKIPLFNNGGGLPYSPSLLISEVKGSNDFVSFFNFNKTTKKIWGRGSGHRILKCDSKKILTYPIIKNASSFLFNLFCKQKFNFKLREFEHPWYNEQLINHSADLNILPRENQYQLNNYPLFNKFVVLRDPIDRFVTIVNSSKDPTTIIGTPFNNHCLFSEDYNYYINLFIAICRCSKEIECTYFKDPAYMTQSEHLRGVDIGKVNDFVKIEDLNKYLLQYNLKSTEYINSYNEKFIDTDDFTEDQLNEIKEIYKEDIDLYNNVKFWNNV